jgi:hypothetical protein
MGLVECGKGHIYDADQYQSCPYCNGGMYRVEFGQDDGSSIGKTAPVNGYAQQNVQAIGAPVDLGVTVAPSEYMNRNNDGKKEEDTGKTVAVFQKSMHIEMVVGWLVCTEGSDKGKDYRIYAKNNSIGRSEKMDICIKGDNTISRENHARIAYDERHNAFHLIPGESANNIYVAGEPIYVPYKLEAYEQIELGETKLVFVPFCNDRFNWQDGLK